MTALEQKVKEAARETILQVLPAIKEWEPNAATRYYLFIYDCDGVLDEISYDRLLKVFTVNYSVGVGSPYFTNPHGVSLFDETEIRTLSIAVSELE